MKPRMIQLSARPGQPAPTRDLNAAVTNAVDAIAKKAGVSRERCIELLHKNADLVGSKMREHADRNTRVARLASMSSSEYSAELEDVKRRLIALGATLPSEPQLSPGERDSVDDFVANHGMTRAKAIDVVQKAKARGMRFKPRPRS